MEKDFHTDPATHENRLYLNISTRAWITVGITVAACLPVIALSVTKGWGIYTTGMICMGIGILAGLIVLSKMHHLYFENWFPLWLREKRAPRELILQPAVLILPRKVQRFSIPEKVRAEIQRYHDRQTRKQEDLLDAELVKTLFPETDNR